MNLVEQFITGVTAIALITAIGLHAEQLASLVTSLGGATSGLLNTTEKG